MTDQIQSLPLSRITLSQTAAQAERRQHFDKAAIAELAESIKTVGMLSPIIARPVKGNGHIELVAGERRYLAAKHANLAEIPVTVRDLTDEQVLEVQLVENLQREGLHELAEAEGYEGLQKLGHSAEEIADKVGKSKAYVYARMKLLALTPAARKAFYGGKITASVALLLARIPVEKIQGEALKQVTNPRWNDDGPMSYREASRLIQNDYMLRLSDAGFKTEDATLVPAAGTCGACPKRTGNQAELFGDIKGADVCTDPVCFKSKLAAHAARTIEQAAARGQKVITGPAAKKIFPYHGDEPDSQQGVSLSAKCWEDAKGRTYAQLLGKDFEPTLVVHPESGKVVKVATRDQVRTTFKEKGIKTAKSNVRNSDAAAQKKVKLERKFRRALYTEIRPKLPDHMGPEDYRVLALRLLERAGHDSVKILAELWKLEAVKPKYGPPDFEKAAEKYLETLLEERLPEVFFDMIFVSELHVWTYGSGDAPKLMLATAKKLRVDVDQIRKDCQSVKAKARKRTP